MNRKILEEKIRPKSEAVAAAPKEDGRSLKELKKDVERKQAAEILALAEKLKKRSRKSKHVN